MRVCVYVVCVCMCIFLKSIRYIYSRKTVLLDENIYIYIETIQVYTTIVFQTHYFRTRILCNAQRITRKSI